MRPVATAHTQIVFLAWPEVELHELFLAAGESAHYFARLRSGIAWRQESMRIAGREVNFPRLTAWYGEPDAVYTYSGVRNIPLAWTAELLEIKGRVEAVAGEQFNSVLLNLYRDGADSMGWHSDDEREIAPTIASLSLGASRTFQIRRKAPPAETTSMRLSSGSLLLMRGNMQRDWRHRVPKEPAVGERINLTFRRVTGRSQ